MVSSVSRAWSILKGRQSGNAEEAYGLLDEMPVGTRMARQRSETKTNSRPKFYKKYRMGMRVY